MDEPIFQILLVILLLGILGVNVWNAAATHFLYRSINDGEPVDAYGEMIDMGIIGAARRAKRGKK